MPSPLASCQLAMLGATYVREPTWLSAPSRAMGAAPHVHESHLINHGNLSSALCDKSNLSSRVPTCSIFKCASVAESSRFQEIEAWGSIRVRHGFREISPRAFRRSNSRKKIRSGRFLIFNLTQRNPRSPYVISNSIALFSRICLPTVS